MTRPLPAPPMSQAPSSLLLPPPVPLDELPLRLRILHALAPPPLATLSVPDFEGEAVGFVQDYNPSLRARSEGLARRPQKSNRSMKLCIYAAQHIDRSSEVVPATAPSQQLLLQLLRSKQQTTAVVPTMLQPPPSQWFLIFFMWGDYF